MSSCSLFMNSIFCANFDLTQITMSPDSFVLFLDFNSLVLCTSNYMVCRAIMD